MSEPEPSQESPPPSPWQPPAPPAARTARTQMLIAWLVLALAVVIVAAITSPYWAPGIAPLLPWGQQPPSLAPNVDTIRDLQSRLDVDEKALKQQAAQLARLGADEAMLKDLATRLADLEARPVPAAAPIPAAATPAPAAPSAQSPDSAAAIKALQDQVAKLTASSAAAGDRLAKLDAGVKQAIASGGANHAVLLALANLRVAAEGAAPFTAELAAAQALAGNDTAMKTALASLGNDAKTGLPTTAALAERFDRGVAPAILRARRDDANADWWQQMRSRLERLVVIRRVGSGGPAPSDATEAAVAKAGAALRAGDLAAAVAALTGLTSDGAKAAAPWLAQANKRVGAEATLATLWQNEVAKSGAKP